VSWRSSSEVDVEWDEVSSLKEQSACRLAAIAG
jgi:hypothetical protein